MERAPCVRAARISVHVCACVVSACGARGQPALAAHAGEFVRVRHVGGAIVGWRIAYSEHVRNTFRSTSGARVEHNSENLVVSVFLLYLVIVSDCSFRIWLDEIRGEGRESFGDNFWAASKKFSVQERCRYRRGNT